MFESSAKPRMDFSGPGWGNTHENGSTEHRHIFLGDFHPIFRDQGRSKSPYKTPLNSPAEYPLHMRQLQSRQILLFRILKEHCLFLTRPQIERVLTLAPRATNKQLHWLVAGNYLARRYRVDSFSHFQLPLYYLGTLGWHIAGNPMDTYKQYSRGIVERSDQQMEHSLAVYDVLLKFLLESAVKRVIKAEDALWQEPIGLGIIPDAWVQSEGGGAFIEIDLNTEGRAVVGNKFDSYLKFKDSGNYGRLFPGCQFKVLFVTTTEERIESLQQITTSDDIWFSTMDEFLREQLNHAHWFAMRGFYALPTVWKKEM